MLAQGKITVTEAEQLIGALGVSPGRASADHEGDPARSRYLRVAVHKAASERRPEKDVSIRVPLSLVRSGMRLGAMIPGAAGERITERLREKGLDIDLAKLDPAHLETMLKNLGELTIDVDQGKAQVRITCE
jgi:hypothetical protein